MHYESKLFEKAQHIRQASEDEKQRLATANLTIAKYLVGISYNKLGRYPSPEDYKKDYLAEYNRLITIAHHNPTEYAKAVSDFSDSSAANEVPELEAEVTLAFNAMNTINVGGERRADAPKVLASRLIGGIGKYSAKSLGVDVSRINGSKKTLMSKLFGKGTYDPNVRGTKEEDRAQTIDRDLFKTERLYRMQLEDDIKRLKSRGGLSDEEMRLITEHNKMKKAQIGIGKKEITEAQRIMSSMTDGEKAIYDVAKLPFTMLKGIGKFILGPKRGKRNSVEDEKVSDLSELESTPKNTENVPNITPKIMDSELELHKNESLGNRKEVYKQKTPKPTQPELEPPDNKASSVELSDISADYNTKNIELSEKNNEKLDKQIELLEKIDKDIIGINCGGGGGIISTAADIAAAAAAGAAKAATAAKAVQAVEAAEALETAAPVIESTAAVESAAELLALSIGAPVAASMAIAIPGIVTGVLEYNKRKEDIAESKRRGYAVRNESHSPSFLDVIKGGSRKNLDFEINKADAKYSKYGYSGMSGNFVDANGNRISDDKAHEMRKAIDDPFSIEPVKKTTSSKLSDKKVKADEAKAKKTTEAMAGAVSNVVHNAPNNSIVATPIATKNRGRDNPRNPDNQLNIYLENRVMKYC